MVSTTVGAINEAVQNGVTGTMVSPRNPTLLAEALSKLMNDHVLREKMGKAGYRYAQQHFGIDVMLDKMETIFRKVSR